MPEVIGRILRYLIVGGTAALVDVTGFGLTRSLGIPLVAGATASFLAAAIVNFLLSARWVFGVAPTLRKFGPFLFGTLAGLTANVVVTAMSVGRLGLSWGASKLLGIAVALVLNWINANIAFNRGADRSLTPSQRIR